jgi:hypothetical protein
MNKNNKNVSLRSVHMRNFIKTDSFEAITVTVASPTLISTTLNLTVNKIINQNDANIIIVGGFSYLYLVNPSIQDPSSINTIIISASGTKMITLQVTYDVNRSSDSVLSYKVDVNEDPLRYADSTFNGYYYIQFIQFDSFSLYLQTSE